jgi:molybdopterin synthase catalytic subunit
MASIRLTRSRLSVPRAYSELEEDESGGVVVFAGRVRPDRVGARRVTALDYEADQPMALRSLDRIAGTATGRFHLRRVLLWHRVGSVPVGEVSVIVGASAMHRAEAFGGARWMIDRLKSETPIWKMDQARPARPRRPRPSPGRERSGD